ncbi:aldehyde dehydrogenase family protein [Paraburkholderia silviterrae]|uniref:Aldehyde dehydrogenase family protein n=1 Tax=Paraburkholderia silviterrae TaxID=2528715 RepID=A0A4V6PJ10_9BURK|nr:aldehyde dehydrogenase family protein [Paraburkholderia silviterrae]
MHCGRITRAARIIHALAHVSRPPVRARARIGRGSLIARSALYARVAAGGRAEAAIAVKAAAAAFPAWAQTTPAERAMLFFKAAEIVKRRRAEIARILAQETGSTISFATFQQDLVAATIEQAVGWMYLPKGEVLETNVAGTHSIGVRRPLGVIASFTPWNGASVLSWRAVLSPIAAGNTVVVKPSELSPISAGLILAQIVEEVDTAEQAVEAANRTLYGLTSSIVAGDTYRAFELAPKIQAGIVNVNSATVNDEIHAPMGGVRDSGWGRTGPDSLKEFQDVIWINSHSGQRQYPF